MGYKILEYNCMGYRSYSDADITIVYEPPKPIRWLYQPKPITYRHRNCSWFKVVGERLVDVSPSTYYWLRDIDTEEKTNRGDYNKLSIMDSILGSYQNSYNIILRDLIEELRKEHFVTLTGNTLQLIRIDDHNACTTIRFDIDKAELRIWMARDPSPSSKHASISLSDPNYRKRLMQEINWQPPTQQKRANSLS